MRRMFWVRHACFCMFCVCCCVFFTCYVLHVLRVPHTCPVFRVCHVICVCHACLCMFCMCCRVFCASSVFCVPHTGHVWGVGHVISVCHACSRMFRASHACSCVFRVLHTCRRVFHTRVFFTCSILRVSHLCHVTHVRPVFRVPFTCCRVATTSARRPSEPPSMNSRRPAIWSAAMALARMSR